MSNIDFFRNNVDFYSEEYRDYSLKPWEMRLVDRVSGKDVLDVACGGGRITVPLLRRGHDVTGTDFVVEFETMIRQHSDDFVGEFRFVESDMTALPFSDASFDSVVCVNSIVYLPNLRSTAKALREMSRVLKPGGGLYITTWNLLHPLWGTSVVLNFLIGRGSRFGETSPFWTTDSRIRNSRTRMFVPSSEMLCRMCTASGIVGAISTGSDFAGNHNLLAELHPVLVLAGHKR